MLNFPVAMVVILTAAAFAQSSAPDLDTIVSRLETAQAENRTRIRPYTVTREYELYDDKGDQPDSRVTAMVNFVPPHHSTFEIEQVKGSDRGEKVVRKILEGESNFQGQNDTTLKRENYTFSYVGQEMIEGRRCYVLKLEPRRKEKGLVRGQAWIDGETYLPRLVEGEMAKTPSWWLKDVHVRLRFADVEGMWLSSGTQAVADVRIFGKHKLVSHATDYHVAETVALNRPVLPGRTAAMPQSDAAVQPRPPEHSRAAATHRAVKRRPPQPAIVLGAGVLTR